MAQATRILHGAAPSGLELLARSPPPDRVPAGYDPIDEFGDSSVRFSFGVCTDGVLVRYRGVVEETQDLVLWQETSVIHGKQERLTDRKGGHSCMVGLHCHPGWSFLHVAGQATQRA